MRRIADSSSKNAVSFSSARTTKRFSSPRCASATKIGAILGIVDHLRRRFARFNLRAHALQARSKRVNLLLLARDSRLEALFLFCNNRFQFLHLAMFFEKLVEQHRVNRFVAHGKRFAVGIIDESFTERSPMWAVSGFWSIEISSSVDSEPIWDCLRRLGQASLRCY